MIESHLNISSKGNFCNSCSWELEATFLSETWCFKAILIASDRLKSSIVQSPPSLLLALLTGPPSLLVALLTGLSQQRFLDINLTWLDAGNKRPGGHWSEQHNRRKLERLDFVSSLNLSECSCSVISPYLNWNINQFNPSFTSSVIPSDLCV